MIMLHSNVTKTVPDYHYVDNDDDIVHIFKGCGIFLRLDKTFAWFSGKLFQGMHFGNFSIYKVYDSKNSTKQVKL